jgi:cytoskeleton protein RodZ
MEKVLGQALRKEREARGVTLADIASETRIGTRFLQALENEDFDVFPGKFYLHYYIKNYLKACGADETAFFNTYRTYLNGIMKEGRDTPPDQFMQKMDYHKFRRSRKILVAVMLLAILLLLAYLFFGPPRWFDLVLRFKPEAAAPAAAVTAPAPPARADRPPAAAEVTASMTFDAPCWLQAWRGAEKVVEKTFAKGDSFNLTAPQLTLFIANPPAARLQLNGRDVTFLRTSAKPVKLVVDPSTLQEILQR